MLSVQLQNLSLQMHSLATQTPPPSGEVLPDMLTGHKSCSLVASVENI